MFDNHDVACVGPWYEIRINADSTVTYCHASSDLETTDLPWLNWWQQGGFCQGARTSIQSGQPLDGCQRCYASESKDFVSYKQRVNLQAAIWPGPYQKESFQQSPAWSRLQQTQVGHRPSRFHVSLSNLCNLSCRMCQPKFSSNLSQNMKRIGLYPKDADILHDWTQGPRWQQFLDMLKNNKEILSVHFMGGEPMLHKKFYSFLQWCVSQKLTDFHITFVTNGTIWNKEAFNLLNHFKSVQVEISVENFHPSNDYIRINGDYKKIRDNINQWCVTRKGNFDIILRTVPQALSIGHYDTLIYYAREKNLIIDNNVLSDPDFLQISVLPQHYKDKCLDTLDKINLPAIDDLHINLRNLNEIDKNHAQHISMLRKLLTDTPSIEIEHKQRQFRKYNHNMDAISSLKFKDVYPDLEEFYAQFD